MLDSLKREIVEKIVNNNLEIPTVAASLNMSNIYLTALLKLDCNFEDYEKVLNIINQKLDYFIDNGFPQPSKILVKL